MPAPDSVPDPLLSRLVDRAQALSADGQRILVGFSGGLDSTVLLHLLARIAEGQGFALEAAHVHHGLSPHADDWLQHCREVCALLDVPLHECLVEVKGQGGGIEAAARDARHTALAGIPCDWIALAHHRGDQAETLMHRLLRGAGVYGAAAMRTSDAARRLWRPLLDEPRAELLAWAQTNGLTWVEDDSNADVSLTRNHLRLDVLPLLTQRFPAAEANLARAARHFAEGAVLLDELACVDAQAIDPASAASRVRLCELTPARARNLLRHWLAEAGAHMPDSARLDDALRQLCSDTAVRLPFEGVALCAYRDRLWLERTRLETFKPRVWQGEDSLSWGDGVLYFTPDDTGLALLPGQTQLTAPAPGDRLRPHAQGPSRPFRLLCQEAGVPPWQRSSLPVLRQAQSVVWIGALGENADCRVCAGERGWHVHWEPPEATQAALSLEK